MRIAQIAPLYEAVPPRLYGGTERIVAHLTDALVELGHDVTLFASAEARTQATLVAVPRPGDPARPERAEVRSGQPSGDAARGAPAPARVRHPAFPCRHDPFSVLRRRTPARTVTTLHGRLDLKDLPGVYARWPRVPAGVDLRRPAPAAAGRQLAGHHPARAGGRHSTASPPTPSEPYLAFLGRISPEKRPDRAIEIARRSGMRLKIAAKVDQVDRAYFHEVIEPLLADPLVEFIGEIGDAQKSEFLGNAKALLFPIDWPEPFGLVMIEAMACGTPGDRVALRLGARGGRAWHQRLHRRRAWTRPWRRSGGWTGSTGAGSGPASTGGSRPR